MIRFIDRGNVIEIVPENLKIEILFKIIAEESFLMAVRKKLLELRKREPQDDFEWVLFKENLTAIERLRAVSDRQKEILETMLEVIAREILRRNTRELKTMAEISEDMLGVDSVAGFECGVKVRGELEFIKEGFLKKPLEMRRYFFDKKKFESIQGESSAKELIKRVKFRLG